MKEFIRNNLVLVAVAGATLVLIGVLLAMIVMESGDVTALAQARPDALRDVNAMAAVNDAMVTARERRNESVSAEEAAVLALLEEQAEHYPVLEVALADGKTYQAFPYDKAAYESAGLTLRFTSRYVEKWGDGPDGWLNRLSSIIPPSETDPYLQQRIQYWRTRLLTSKSKALEYIDVVMRNARTKLDKLTQQLKKELDKLSEQEGGTAPGVGAAPPGGLPSGPYYPEQEGMGPYERGIGRPRAGAPVADPATQALANRYNAAQRGIGAVDDILEKILVTRATISEAVNAIDEVARVRKRVVSARPDDTDAALLPDLLKQWEEALRKALDTVETTEAAMKKDVAAFFSIDLEHRAVAGASAPPEASRTLGVAAGREEQPPQLGRDFDEEKKQSEAYVRSTLSLADAERYAWPDAIKARATSGRIYAVVEALDRYFRDPVLNASPEDLWKMQVNAWVMDDVLRAIDQTNEDVLSELPAERRNVLNSAVKRLLAINVDEQYYTRSDASARRYVDREGAPGAIREEGVAGQTLTGDVCDKDYDVVHYNFTVEMPQRHVLVLVDNLLTGRLHDVLCVSTRRAGAEDYPRPDMGKMPAAGSRHEANVREGGFYYGAEPVMQVTIYGQVRLSTVWARKLMPAAALRDQFGLSLSSERRKEVLSEEDIKRAGFEESLVGRLRP